MGARDFFIVDDLFGQYRSDSLKLCRMLRDYQVRLGKKLKFAIQIRLDRAKDTELLQAMREANVTTVAIGFESPINEELSAMDKCLKAESMLKSAKVYRKFGFFVHGMFIFGYPMQEGKQFTMSINERIKHFKRFIRKARLDTIQALLPVPLPGTELRKRLLAQGRVYPLKDIGWEYYDGNFPIIEPDAPMTAEDMQMAIRKIMGRFYHIRYLFMFIINIFYFPHIVFYFHHIKSGWKRWYRRWRTYIFRIGGSKILKKWTYHLQRGSFPEKMRSAQKHLHNPVGR